MGYSHRYPTLGKLKTITTPNYDDLFGGDLQHLSIREVAENHPHCLTQVKLRFAVIRHPVAREHFPGQTGNCVHDEPESPPYAWGLITR